MQAAIMADHGIPGRPRETMADYGRLWQTMANHGKPGQTKAFQAFVISAVLHASLMPFSSLNSFKIPSLIKKWVRWYPPPSTLLNLPS